MLSFVTGHRSIALLFWFYQILGCSDHFIKHFELFDLTMLTTLEAIRDTYLGESNEITMLVQMGTSIID